MSGLLTVTLLVTLMGLLAMRFGVDSRDGRDWSPQPGQRQWQPTHRPARRTTGSRSVLLRSVQAAAQRGDGGSSRPRSVGGAA